MNYKKVIKDLKERNDKLQEQYRLRDIRCVHLEYENEMLKSDFEAQHELTEKYAEENQKYKKVIDKARECIKNFLCTEEYINVNGIAIADNYSEVLDILKEVSE